MFDATNIAKRQMKRMETIASKAPSRETGEDKDSSFKKDKVKKPAVTFADPVPSSGLD